MNIKFKLDKVASIAPESFHLKAACYLVQLSNHMTHEPSAAVQKNIRRRTCCPPSPKWIMISAWKPWLTPFVPNFFWEISGFQHICERSWTLCLWICCVSAILRVMKLISNQIQNIHRFHMHGAIKPNVPESLYAVFCTRQLLHNTKYWTLKLIGLWHCRYVTFKIKMSTVNTLLLILFKAVLSEDTVLRHNDICVVWKCYSHMGQ